MIVRIMGEGQVDLSEADLDLLNAFDDALEQAIESGNETAFRTALHDLLERVRNEGSPVPPETLEPSAFILPHAEASMDEVEAMLGDEGGLIPGPA